jgi:ankyrin repeat protein
MSRLARPAGQQTLDIQAALAAGADPDDGLMGTSAMTLLVANGGEPEAARLLLRAGAGDARAQVLHAAVRSGSLEIAKVVLDYARAGGLDGWVDVRDAELRTPLLSASGGATPGFVQLFLEYGADVTVVDDQGNTALHGVGHPEIARLLLQRGAHVNARTRLKASTPLHHARTAEVADALMDGGADLDAQDSCGYTPAMYAAITGRPRVAMRLLQRGASVAARDQNGHTLLGHAICNGHAGLMNEVLKRDACAAQDVDVAWAVEEARPTSSHYCDRDDEGCTPMACVARLHDPAATVRTDGDVAVYLVALQREARALQRVTPDLQEAACQLAARWHELHGTR